VVALWWRGDVHDIWRCRAQHFLHIFEASEDTKSLRQLSGHQRFAVAHCHDVAIGYPADCLDVLIGDLAAAYYRDAKHRSVRPRWKLRKRQRHRLVHADPRSPLKERLGRC
jgi:hypothetical protein